MTWIITILSIIGVILNIYKNKYCFMIWAVTNFAWMVIDYRAGLYSQSLLFAVYFLLAIYGLWKWIEDAKLEALRKWDKHCEIDQCRTNQKLT